MTSKTDYVNLMLISLLGNPKLVETWWTTPNKAFESLPPKEVEETKVIKYLEKFCY